MNQGERKQAMVVNTPSETHEDGAMHVLIALMAWSEYTLPVM